MKVLVGMPAYKLEGSVRKTLESMVTSPAEILVIDNNSAEDVKAVIASFGNRLKVIHNDVNRGCNGAWNQILHYGTRNGFDVIGLQSDTIVMPGWYNAMTQYVADHPKEVVITNLDWPFDHVKNHTFEVSGSPLTFYPREAAEIIYPIPPTLIHWFGDTYAFVKLRRLGWKMTVVSAVRALHAWSEVTAVSPEMNPVVPQDKAEWLRLFPEIRFE